MKIVRPLSVGDTGSFTRASTAAYWDKNGRIQFAAIDSPRVSYDPENLSKAPAFLFENAAENRCFNNTSLGANWGPATDWIDNVSVAPDNTTTMTRATNTMSGLNTSVTTAGMYTFSLYVKPAISSRVTLRISGQSNGIPAKSVEFYTHTGGIVMSHPSETTAKIEWIANGFVRVQMCVFIEKFVSLQVWAGSVAGDTIEVWRPQLELGEVATSVIYTTGSVGVRATDVSTMDLLSLLPENDAPVWSSTSAYSVGEQCIVVSDGTHKVFVSLIGRSSVVGINTAGTTDLLNWDAHGLTANQPVRLKSTGDLPTSINANTTYYASIVNANQLYLRTVVNGANIQDLTGSTGTVTCYTAENVNKNPVTSPSFWADAGATNKYAMFDGSVDSQTVSTDHIAAAIKIPATTYVDTLVVQNLDNAKYARVVVTDATEGVVYDKQVDLISNEGINDWGMFFFEPPEYLKEFILTDLPPYAGAIISISFSNVGQTLKCGLCLFGMSRFIGHTQAGMQLGIQDYSVKETDEFGNTTIVERPYSRTMSASVWVDVEQRGAVLALLNSFRATPVIYIGDVNDPTSALYGYFRDYSDGIDQPTVSVLNLEIESLK